MNLPSLTLRAGRIRSLEIVALHDDCNAAWHSAAPAAPSSPAGFDRSVVEQHLANFELWHAEDCARAPGAGDPEIARIKRFIDSTNQRRSDLGERLDADLLDLLRERQLPAEDAELHSESPGLMIDRLSILSLKLFHTREQIERQDGPPGHAGRNRERLTVLVEQRDDLAACFDRLWRRVLAGERRFKVYRQCKMYNDPALNPAVYLRGSRSRS